MSTYRTQSRDTTRSAEELVFEHLRSLSPAQRAEQVTAMTESMHEVVQAGIRLRHPEASDEELFYRTAARWLGPELTKRVYGWDVEEMGW